MGDDDGRMHVAEVVRVASAFTPAVPLRVVMLVLDPAGVTPIELDVVGCVHRVADEYRLLVPAGQSAPFPAGVAARGPDRRGVRVRPDRRVGRRAGVE